MPRVRATIAVLAVLVLGGATMAFAGTEGSDRRDGGPRAQSAGDHDRGYGWARRHAAATLRNADGERVGRVEMRERRWEGGVLLVARVHDLAPGFHGFHVHTTGRCDAPAFTTAGGHFNPTAAGHGDHAGDLPSLLVNEDGTAVLATVTDRFSIRDLRDADGSAVIVHSGRDNFANIPARYGGPDAETLSTGDSGSRVACGVVR